MKPVRWYEEKGETESAWEGEKKIFVTDPALPNRFIRTDRCVAFVACPECGADVVVPCGIQIGSWRKYSAGAHPARSRAYTALRKTIR